MAQTFQPLPDPDPNAPFWKCMDVIDREEGGFVVDSGGPTNHGVTQHTYDKYRTATEQTLQPVQKISDEEVDDIYYNWYWLAFGCDKLPTPLALCVFQACINMRPKTVLMLVNQGNGDWRKFLDAQITEYKRIANARPDEAKYLNSWLNRVALTRKIATTY